MTERSTELVKGLVVGHKRDGRSCYDREAKRRLIEAAMQPGVSVARMALEHGINANLLRTWIRRHQEGREVGKGTTSVALSSAFIPVVPAVARSDGRQSLTARLPNGIQIEFESNGRDDLAAILRQLCALPCSGSTPG